MANQSTPVIQIKDSNVGIGTTSPTRKLQITDGEVYVRFNPTAVAGNYILGAADGRFYVIPESTFVPTMTFNSGNVLIGTTTDNGYRLNVNGITNITGGTITAGSETTYAFRVLQGKPLTFGGDDNYAYIQSWSSGPLVINGQGNNVLFSNGSTNVLIGTTSDSGAKLTINGGAAMTSGWQRSLLIGATYPSLVMFSGAGGNSYVAHQWDSGSNYIFNMGSNNDTPLNGVVYAVNASTRNFLIGTTTDVGTKLNVNGVVSATDYYFNGTSSERVVKRYTAGINLAASGYTFIANVTGSSLASAIRMTMQGTSNSVVINVLADIQVNHFQDILITTSSGFYTQLTIRIISNQNDVFSIEVEPIGAIDATTLYVEIYPLNDEVVSFSGSPQTATTLTMATRQGIYTVGTGGNNGTISAGGDLYVSENVGIGTTGPAEKLTLTSGSTIATARFTNSTTGLDFRLGTDGVQSSYTNMVFYSDSGNAQIWKAGSTYTSQGGAASLNLYSSNGPIAFHPNGGASSNAMFLTTTQNVLIGTTTDNGAKLNVNGTSYISGAASFGSTIGVNGNVTLTQDTNDLIFQQTNSSSHGIVWKNTSYTKDSASIRPTGNGAWTTQGIGFYTGNAGDSTTAPSLRFNIQAGGDAVFYNRLNVENNVGYSLQVSQNLDTSSSTFDETLFLLNTFQSDSGYASIGMSTNGTDGQHHRVTLKAFRDSNIGGQLQIFLREAGTANNVSRVTFRSSGNVGIGTTTPTAPLEITNTGSAGGGYNMFIASYSAAKQWGMRKYGIDNGSGIAFSSDVQFSSTWYSATRIGHGQNAANPSLQTYYGTQLATTSGNVLIGTTTDNGYTLYVNGTGFFNNVLRASAANTFPIRAIATSGGVSRISFEDNVNQANDAVWVGSEGYNLCFGSNFSEQARISSSGNLIIGSTTDAGYKLDVYGEIIGRDDIRILNTYALVLNGTDNNWRIGRNTITDSGWLTSNTLQIVVFGGSSGQGFQVVNTNGTALFEIDGVAGASRFTNALGVGVNPSGTAGRIDASNDIVAYSSSDLRLKENIKPIENALDKVKALTGVEFDWKVEHKEAHGYEGHDTGIIAQEVQEIMPTAVRTNDTGYLAVRYEKLIGLLIEAVKEQQAEIDELKKLIK